MSTVRVEPDMAGNAKIEIWNAGRWCPPHDGDDTAVVIQKADVEDLISALRIFGDGGKIGAGAPVEKAIRESLIRKVVAKIIEAERLGGGFGLYRETAIRELCAIADGGRK